MEKRTRLKNFKLAWIATLFLFAMPGFSAFFSIGEPAVAWSKKSLRVCWASSPAHVKATRLAQELDLSPQFLSLPSPAEKKLVRALITREFTSARTGLSFTGWTDCKPRGETADVYLFAAQSADLSLSALTEPERAPAPAGLASIGQSGIREEFTNAHGVSGSGYRKKDLKKKSYVFLRLPDYSLTQISAEETLALNALHEFGHLAGLRHEHLRPEAKNDPHCVLADTNLSTREHLSPLLTAKSFGVYDPQSIMNYCYLDLIEKITGLRYYEKISEAPATLPGGSGSILSAGQTEFLDPRITSENLDDPNYREIRLRSALSSGDLHALRCLYAYPSATRRLRCTEAYDPLAENTPARN